MYPTLLVFPRRVCIWDRDQTYVSWYRALDKREYLNIIFLIETICCDLSSELSCCDLSSESSHLNRLVETVQMRV